MHKLALLLLCAGGALAQYQCTEDGFYIDSQQCDKYYDCYRGQKTEKLCPDGLVFDHTLGPAVEQCNYPFIVECPAQATLLQAARSSGVECPRQNGYFEHEDPQNCMEYYECSNGLPVLRKCASGLVFDEFTGTCQWAATGLRTGCVEKKESLNGFICPNATQVASNGAEYDHGRYAADDCRYFYVCEDGNTPREIGCPAGTVFNDLSLLCDDPANVPGCENYYPENASPVSQAGLGRF